jgi:hypothetical protein
VAHRIAQLNRRPIPRPIRRWAGVFALAFAASLAVPPAAPAEAAPPAEARIADLGYDVYIGGLHVFSFAIEMTLRPESYRVSAEGGTRGAVAWFSSWGVKLDAEGSDSAGRIASRHYVVETDWKKDPARLQLDFAGDGRYALERVPAPDPAEPPDPDIEGTLPETLPQGALDPLSFAVAAGQALQRSGHCDQTVPVFDGQRRYDVTVKDGGPTVLAPNGYSIFSGTATRCTLQVTRISGFRKSTRMSAAAAAKAAPPTVYMAAPQPGMPPVPVRFESEIKLGQMVIHLADAKFRTEPLAEQSGMTSGAAPRQP